MTLQQLLGDRRDRLGFETTPLLGATLPALRKAYGDRLRSKPGGHVLMLPPVAARRRSTTVMLELDARGQVREYVVLFPMASDTPAVRAAFERHWGPARTSREHKCMLRGCVYRRKPTIVVRAIETQLLWSIRVMSR